MNLLLLYQVVVSDCTCVRVIDNKGVCCVEVRHPSRCHVLLKNDLKLVRHIITHRRNSSCQQRKLCSHVGTCVSVCVCMFVFVSMALASLSFNSKGESWLMKIKLGIHKFAVLRKRALLFLMPISCIFMRLWGQIGKYFGCYDRTLQLFVGMWPKLA